MNHNCNIAVFYFIDRKTQDDNRRQGGNFRSVPLSAERGRFYRNAAGRNQRALLY